MVQRIRQGRSASPLHNRAHPQTAHQCRWYKRNLKKTHKAAHKVLRQRKHGGTSKAMPVKGSRGGYGVIVPTQAYCVQQAHTAHLAGIRRRSAARKARKSAHPDTAAFRQRGRTPQGRKGSSRFGWLATSRRQAWSTSLQLPAGGLQMPVGSAQMSSHILLQCI